MLLSVTTFAGMWKCPLTSVRVLLTSTFSSKNKTIAALIGSLSMCQIFAHEDRGDHGHRDVRLHAIHHDAHRHCDVGLLL